SSDGCSDTGPKPTQRRAPSGPARPMPGTSTKNSSAIETSTSPGDRRRSVRMGTVRAPMNSTAPTTVYISWLRNIENAEPPTEIDSTEDAESTIASPETDSSTVTATTRWNDSSGPRHQAASAEVGVR